MTFPVQTPPSGRSIIVPATLVAALIAAPMLAFSQTAPTTVPGTPPGSAATMAPGAPAARPGTTTTPAPHVPGTTTTQAPGNTTAQPRTAAPMGASGQAGMATNRASRIIGANVLNERNETVGEIEDLILNASGAAPMAVLSVGGFLGIGARLVAVPLSELNFNAERERWVLNGATKESLQARPAYTYQRS